MESLECWEVDCWGDNFSLPFRMNFPAGYFVNSEQFSGAESGAEFDL